MQLHKSGPHEHSALGLTDVGGSSKQAVPKCCHRMKVKSFFAALTTDDNWTPVRDEQGEVRAIHRRKGSLAFQVT